MALALDTAAASAPRFHRWWLVLLLGLVGIGPGPSDGQDSKQPAGPTWVPPTSLDDPRMAGIRRASVGWDLRKGPQRTVVDQVCLVPDLATFLSVVSTWDRGHYFPILIDDAETTLRFLKAFKPSRVVRFPKAAAAIAAGDVWSKAVASVGDSWKKEGDPAIPALAGDVVPGRLGPTPAGVVLSSPDSSTLAASVALAAGRFQPLIRLDSPKKFADSFSNEEFEAFARAIEEKVNARVPNHLVLGDGCDFLTLGGDWPYSYRNARGDLLCTDDGVGRLPSSKVRWAFAGRLIGGLAESVYRSMCSLFLQPESAILFNGYPEDSPPWSDYTMRLAASRFSRVMPTSHASGPKLAGLEGWHEMFDPINPSGLVVFNSQGSPDVFGLNNGTGTTLDVPRTVPAAVITIHSYSAARPDDPSTIAGRWLANGAFVYFGSMDEPFLQSFRTPGLVTDMIGERLPYVVATRATSFEPFAKPWKLTYLGDPLYQLRPKGQVEPRLARWEPSASWPSYAEDPRPSPASEDDLTRWVLKAALSRSQVGRSKPADDLIAALLETRRGRLSASFRPIYDAMLVDLLLSSNRRGDFRAKLATFPEADRSGLLRRANESVVTADFHLAIARGDLSKTRAAWAEMMRLSTPRVFKELTTGLVTKLSDTPVRRHDWSVLLRATLRNQPGMADADVIDGELKKVEATLKADR